MENHNILQRGISETNICHKEARIHFLCKPVYTTLSQMFDVDMRKILRLKSKSMWSNGKVYEGIDSPLTPKETQYRGRHLSGFEPQQHTSPTTHSPLGKCLQTHSRRAVSSKWNRSGKSESRDDAWYWIRQPK